MADTIHQLTPPPSDEEVGEARRLAAEAGVHASDSALVRLVRSARSRRHLVAAGALRPTVWPPGAEVKRRRGTRS